MAFSLNDYDIVAETGQGGFATVFRARQKSLSREVAIKRLSPRRMQNATEILRFKREAEAMAALTHDNIVSVFDYAFHDGSYYIVMEYVDGMTFDAALERNLPRECCLFVLEKAAAALRTAHEQNIIHRDIKPANLLLGKNGQVKLADFGIALFRTGIESFTSPGSVLGTISYMAPEALVSPKEVDYRVDIFSLGVILYQVLAGKHPFEGADFGEISNHLLNDDPPPLPPPLGDIALGCLRKDREKRPPMAELHEALTTALQGVYHKAQEKLTAFVRKDSGYKTSATVQEIGAVLPGKKRHRRRRIAVIAALSSLAAVITAAAIASLSLFTIKRSPPPPLPSLPSVHSSAEGGGISRESAPQKAEKGIQRDGPPPLTGSDIDMNVGTLLIRGATAQDTIMINGSPVPVSKVGGDRRLKLLPGRYTIDIRKREGAPVRRELELLPFERQTIDLRKERR